MLLSGEAPVPPLCPAIDDVVGVGLGDASGNRAYSQLRDQLHADGRARVDALEVVDELREVFNAVDVVMRRRTDERNARLRVTQARDEFADLVSGKLAAFAGLGALRDLDFQLFGVDQVLGGDAKASGGDLLDLIVEQRHNASSRCRRAYRPLDLRHPRRCWSARPAGSWRW